MEYIYLEDSEWELPTLPIVIAYNASTTLHQQHAWVMQKCQKWKLENVKALCVVASTCITDIYMINDQNIATNIDMLRQGLEKAVTALYPIARTLAYIGSRVRAWGSLGTTHSAPHTVSTPPGSSMSTWLSILEQAPVGISSFIYPLQPVTKRKWLLCQCGYSTHKSNDYISHQTKQHNLGQMPQCQYCAKEFSGQKSRIEHERNIHRKGQPVKCSKCDKMFKRMNFWKKHPKILMQQSKRFKMWAMSKDVLCGSETQSA